MPLLMALHLNTTFVPIKRSNRFLSIPHTPQRSSRTDVNKRGRKPVATAKAIRSFINPFEDPILKDALKEPIAFLGGMFAGLLRLDLKEEPLREWISSTVEAAGVAAEGEIDEEVIKAEDGAPQQIEIE